MESMGMNLDSVVGRLGLRMMLLLKLFLLLLLIMLG